MAITHWTSAAIGATEAALTAADKPLIGANVIPVSPLTAIWTEVGAKTDTDRTLAANPARRAYDGYHHYPTKPDATASSTWHYVLDLGETVDLDFVAISGHNFGTLSLTTVELELDDGAPAGSGTIGGAFTNVVTIADFGSPSDDSRLIDLELMHTGSDARRYLAVQHLRLKLSKGSNFTPELGELIIGRRRQLEYKANRPFGDKDLHDETATARTAGGVGHKTVFHRRRYDLEAEFVVDATTYENDWTAFHQDCRGSFVWIEDPATSPNNWRLMVREPDELVMPRVEANRRDVTLAGYEQGPERYYLDKE